MMQHVATAKSEVAAFATGTKSNSLTEPGTNEQFDKILQQSTDDINKVSSSGSVGHASSKIKHTSNQHAKNLEPKTPSLLQGKLSTQGAVEGDTSDIDTQEWVSLIDNLQKLADTAQLKKSPEVDAELSAALDITIEEALSNSENLEDNALTDLPLVEDKALLKTLLIEPEADKIDVLEKLIQAQQTETNQEYPEENELTHLSLAEDKALLKTTSAEPEANKIDALEKLIQAQQIETKLPSTSKAENISSNNDIKNILNLSDNKLDKVLESLAQRMFDGKEAVESTSKDFIATLKMGIEEFKHQLSQGKELEADLKSLVSDAFAKMNESGSITKTPINLEQIVKSVSQVLDVAQTMNLALEHHQDKVYSATLRDVAQIQAEQSKQTQSNQFESKFEKAINIAKPEGHQQLAEKVRWMMNTKNLVAEIRLDPAELGSMHVKIAISGETATVNFVVQSQQARDAVDTATPKLREMLAEKGIELGQSSVRQENDEQQSQDNADGKSAGHGARGMNDAEDVEVPEQVFAQHNIINGALGGIDYFV